MVIGGSRTVSFFLLKTGIATEVISSRLWAFVVKSCDREHTELIYSLTHTRKVLLMC